MASEPTRGGLHALAAVISERKSASASQSYTKSLLEAGPSRCAKKFGEEAVECVLAIASEDRDAVIGEAADVLYHLLVALESREISVDEVLQRLDSRAGVSGHEEKAARSGVQPAGKAIGRP